MPNPRVSPYNWERLRGLTQIDMGTDRVDAESVNFRDQLDVVVVEGRTYREDVEGFKSGNKDPSQFYNPDWPDGVTVEIDPNHQNRPHRPYVPDELVEKLENAVEREYPNVPVQSYDFDDLLGLYLDRRQEHLEYLGCELVGDERHQSNNGHK